MLTEVTNGHVTGVSSRRPKVAVNFLLFGNFFACMIEFEQNDNFQWLKFSSMSRSQV
jgi:hypothetical protein